MEGRCWYWRFLPWGPDRYTNTLTVAAVNGEKEIVLLLLKSHMPSVRSLYEATILAGVAGNQEIVSLFEASYKNSPEYENLFK